MNAPDRITLPMVEAAQVRHPDYPIEPLFLKRLSPRAACGAAVGALLWGQAPWACAQDPAPVLRNGDYIAAVVNQELVTAGEVDNVVRIGQLPADLLHRPA